MFARRHARQGPTRGRRDAAGRSYQDRVGELPPAAPASVRSARRTVGPSHAPLVEAWECYDLSRDRPTSSLHRSRIRSQLDRAIARLGGPRRESG
jgi:hypothetical protein